MTHPSIADRLELLCGVYSLPFKLGWDKDTRSDSDTAYKYWVRLELLTRAQFDAVLATGRVAPNPILLSFFKGMDTHFPLSVYRNGSVCDVGSGFGFMTFWVLLSGASVVYTVGDPERIGFMRRLYAAAVAEGLLPPDRIRFKPEFVKVGDDTLHEQIVRGTLDLVLLTDTLEHITPRRLPSLARSAYNDLRPGGLFISKQQNTDSARMMKKLREVWERTERDLTLHQRLEIIQAECGLIAPAVAEELARKTRGLDRPDFYEAVEQFKKDGSFPRHELGIAPVDVRWDVPCEGDTGIDRVMSVFKHAGFKYVRVYPDLMPSRRSRYLQPLARISPRFFLGTGLLDDTSVFVMRK